MIVASHVFVDGDSCEGCPMCEVSPSSGVLCNAAPRSRSILAVDEDFPGIPAWCPLRKGCVVVTLDLTGRPIEAIEALCESSF